VPRGGVKTKPRALNYALPFCRGSIIGIYDAEDAPAPDQLDLVAARFAAAAPDVACLQGVLDFYNVGTNWLSRCFAIEYATWFRVILPGLARLGLVVPHGGTTHFLPREALEARGAGDAHNVTEDADLGLRLARHGFRTELIATVTGEEANCRAWPWIRQRSRWLKGYAMTWAAHMRSPRRLWRDLGAWRFCGVQALFLGTLIQHLTAPLLWSLTLVPFGFPHPLLAVLGPGGLALCAGLFLTCEAINLAVGIAGARRTAHRGLAFWTPTLILYFPLCTIAAWKGVVEIATRPYYWDKTRHGFSPPLAVDRETSPGAPGEG
jgi:cellulose synthase/poly-beta-1,6-N-acetylglucosamine synthase-like glycosyltransferase